MHRSLDSELVSENFTPDHACQLLTKLQSLDGDFRKVYFELIDLVDEEDALENEQATMDTLSVCLQALSTPTEPLIAPTADHRRPLSSKFSRTQTGLNQIDKVTGPICQMLRKCYTCNTPSRMDLQEMQSKAYLILETTTVKLSNV